jgi:hypothetical protein
MDAGQIPGLESADVLVGCYQRCNQLEEAMKLRQAGGGKKSGRYRKHDTARLRCLTRVVYPGLRMGKLPSVTDAKMLFELPGPREITGPSKKLMDDWSNMFARDPRSKTASFETTDEGQAFARMGPRTRADYDGGAARPAGRATARATHVLRADVRRGPRQG